MATQSNAPWRSSRCMQLRKHSALHCVTCNLPWHMVIDNTYMNGMKSPRKIAKEQEVYSSTWQGHHPWQWEQGGHHRPKSPRQKSRPRSARGSRQNTAGQLQQPRPVMPGPPGPGAVMAPMAPMQPMMSWGMQQVPVVPHQYPQVPLQQLPSMPPPETPSTSSASSFA